MRKAVFALWLCCATFVSAQNIEVASCKLLESDLTANTTGTMERDQNGESAALIKVVTTEQGFVFDGGMVGIVKTKQGVGEVWVYVPHGIKRITIQHPQLGVLRDYYFPIPIEKARTYEMVLTTGKVETIVTHSVNKQFVVFNVKPADAIVELGDEVLTVDSEGYATKSMPFGTYDYRVSCANYHTTAGKVTVNAQGKAEVKVELRPNFGWIKLDGASEYRDAHVYVDNVRVGQLPLTTSAMKSGAYRVKVVKSMYKAYERQVSVLDNETTEVNVEMVPNFADVTLVTDENGEIWIDGERKGKGQWTGPLEMGDYTVEVKRESHRTVSDVVQINSVLARTIQLKSPTPIYASLEISSTPLRATVSIDGVEVGETPLMKNDVLVGSRRVTFKKEGYRTMDKTVVLNETSANSVSAELRKVQEVVPVSRPTKKGVSQPMNRSVPIAKKKESPKKGVEWGYMVGADAGYSTYGFNYGIETGITMNRFSIYVGVKSHLMGRYTMCNNDMTGSNETKHSVQLLRFSTKLGYTLGQQFQITPQVGVVFGPSYFIGKKYVTMQIPVWDGVTYNYGKVLAQKDYTVMNANIVKFATTDFRVVLGARLEYRFDFGLGVHVTPEYIIGKVMPWATINDIWDFCDSGELGVNVGVSMKF